MTKLEKNDQRERALLKLRMEIDSNIQRAISAARECGHFDLLLLCYRLRINRMEMTQAPYLEKLSDMELREKHLTDEALKYAISLVAKHGNWHTCDGTLKDFDPGRVAGLLYLIKRINTKFETNSIINTVNVRVIGERDQHFAIDYSSLMEDPQQLMLLHYGIRVERFASNLKQGFLPVEDLVHKLRCEYSGLSDHFSSEFGITLEGYCKGMLDLYRALFLRGKEAEAKLTFNEDGVAEHDTLTFITMATTMTFSHEELITILSPEFLRYLETHSFDGDKFKESELRFHYLTRRPFLRSESYYIFSPELVYDSLQDNARYTLLEGDTSKHKVKEVRSNKFIDQISSIAAKFGYKEVDRDRYLKKGKFDIGDIDLTLYNQATDHTLLVEGKNYTLPLDVYFRSPEAIQSHLKTTQDWEVKVLRRQEHLLLDKTIYPINGTWDYIIISQMPEPLAHSSKLLVLSIHEFEAWLNQSIRPTNFTKFFSTAYDSETFKISEDEMDRYMSENQMSFTPPPGD
ncbi:hypothetical protein PSH66_18045 [Pseudomonas sp. FP597]|uniref:hypothetical protein n=1 Tax=Pseudomonas sp. FP597 TaxID=2954096 RepID=UPI00273324E2|nr:hypothetical protein [Pseudomonas sp. FP597]WLI04513.1 hypothetical protein PSH66_18045 [Pseudomonas sp. FP597]